MPPLGIGDLSRRMAPGQFWALIWIFIFTGLIGAGAGFGLCYMSSVVKAENRAVEAEAEFKKLKAQYDEEVAEVNKRLTVAKATKVQNDFLTGYVKYLLASDTYWTAVDEASSAKGTFLSSVLPKDAKETAAKKAELERLRSILLAMYNYKDLVDILNLVVDRRNQGEAKIVFKMPDGNQEFPLPSELQRSK